MPLKPAFLALVPAIAISVVAPDSAHAATIQIDVQADTYIRNDGGGPTSKNDNDGDDEIIVGINGSATAELNGLLRFDLSPLVGQGDTITSVTLTGTTRAGAPGAGSNLTVTVYDYGFEFIEVDATYNDPDGDGAAGTGDTSPGGTLGSILSSELIANPLPSGQTIVFGDSAEFRTAVSTQLAGDGTLNLLLKGTSADAQAFLRFADEDRPNPFYLTVDIIPEPSTASLLVLSALALIGRRRRR